MPAHGQRRDIRDQNLFSLRPAFFARPTLVVARELLGKFLVREHDGQITAAMITAVEAYDGPLDLASHASRGRTARTSIMFGPPGRWYIYFVYGMHWMLNIVTGPKNYPAAVLIRGVEGSNGPAKLTKALGITGAYNNQPASTKSGLYIMENPTVKHSVFNIKTAPRIGVAYAGPVWSKKPWRFLFQ